MRSLSQPNSSCRLGEWVAPMEVALMKTNSDWIFFDALDLCFSVIIFSIHILWLFSWLGFNLIWFIRYCAVYYYETNIQVQL